MGTLEKEVMGYEATDELIALNKRYMKLDKLYDKYEELIEAVESMEVKTETLEQSLDPNNFDAFKDSKEVKALKKMQEAVYKEMRKISEELRTEIFLFRMIKGALALKTLK